MTNTEIRQSFLNFFREKQHTIVPSSSLLPDAPNLLFTNAGMNQFVPYFLGQSTAPYTPPRAADTQKCIRAGGKHNDLEDVGLDTYHHTFFEMLGNWSFGDYFKKEAIDWAWELLIERWQFPKERLYATYFGGDDKTPADTEARDFWLRYLPAERILPFGRKDNFWMMGDTGPCGPCSEIHMDLTPAGDTHGKLVNQGSAQCIEIWNLVFIQYNANADGTLSALPAKHVDTGMGFERVCGIMQCTDGLKAFTKPISNYNTDVFSPIFRELETLCGRKYCSTLPSDLDESAVRLTAQAGTLAPPKEGQSGSGGASVPACAPRRGITEFKATFRDLPHWQSPGSVYFVTFRTHQGKLLDDAMRDLVLETCRHGHGQKYHLYGVTVMPDHVHLLLWPRPVDPAEPDKGFVDLSEIMHGIKSYTANQLQRRCAWDGPVWQHESFDRIVRDAQEFTEKWDYIAGNAVKKHLAPQPEDYRWFWYASDEPRAEKEPAQGPAAQAGTLAPPATNEQQIKGDIAFRVIADHIRCLSFAIADGITPSNEGRGYVLRRILRRAVRYGRNLGFHEPFFFKLVDVLVRNFGSVFPELRIQEDRIKYVLKSEEESFNRTLDRGLEIFEEVVATLKDKMFPAGEAFKLYDTYGFPLDLTELMARERGLVVDVAGFEKLMGEQRQRAREDYAKKKTAITVAGEGLQVEPTKFLGFENLEAEAVVDSVVPTDKPAEFAIILDRTPFYAEMGGQVGDTGLVHVPGHEWTELGRLQVLDTQREGEVHVHLCKLLPQSDVEAAVSAAETRQPPGTAAATTWRAPEVGEAVRVSVDAERRANIQRHHTVTHLFHWALHEVVSRDARQRGSLVAPDRLRFDFNHPEKLSDQQIADIERLVNGRIKENAPVYWFEAPYQEVKDNAKIMQFFGEKYGKIVRIVQIGGRVDALDGFSMELCGGTHTKTTRDIGMFRITRESAIAAGIRRIEAVCGRYALEFLEQLKDREHAEAEKAKAREQEKELAKQQQAEMQKQAPAIADRLVGEKKRVGEVDLIVENLGEANAEFLRAIIDAVKPKLPSGIAVLGGATEGKVSLICYVTPDLVKKGKHAGKIVGELAKVCGGGGGGKPDLAQAGGKNPEKLAEALAAVGRIVG